MDYVVYGTGYGATLMLLGYAVRTWGPGWRFHEGDEVAYDRRDYVSARASWTRFASGLGAVIATGGAALVLVTFFLMLLDPGDDIGNIVALVVTGLMLVGVAVWAWLYFERFGSWGVVSLPSALSSHEPLRFDSTPSRSRREDETPESSGDDDAFVDEDELDDGVGYDDDDGSEEFVARSSRYEVHSQSGARDEDQDGSVPGVIEDDRFAAQYAKYESHAPSERGQVEADEDVEEVDEYVGTLPPEEISEDIADFDEAEKELVQVEEMTGTRTDVEDDPLEVLPEAHEATGLLPPADDENDGSSGGRAEALQRMRERQARQRSERQDDGV